MNDSGYYMYMCFVLIWGNIKFIYCWLIISWLCWYNFFYYIIKLMYKNIFKFVGVIGILRIFIYVFFDSDVCYKIVFF